MQLEGVHGLLERDRCLFGCVTRGFEGREDGADVRGEGDITVREDATTNSVSYTHLDVYKRQA